MSARMMEQWIAPPQLPEYVRGRRIQLIGASLLTSGWQKMLSTILGTGVLHTSTSPANGLLQRPLHDIVLLGLDDVDVDSEERRIARALVTHLAELYAESAATAVRQPLPQLVIFPTGDQRLHRQALAGHVRESHHFVKVVDEDPLTDDVLRCLEQAIIAALEDRVCHSIGLHFPEGLVRLRKWLENFLPVDRPTALALAERLRFYSVDAMVRLLDNYLQTTSAAGQEQGRIPIPGGERFAPGTYVFSNLGRPFKSASAVLPLVGRSRWVSSFGDDLQLGYLPPRHRRPAVRVYESLAARVFAQVAGHPDGEVLNVVLVDDVIGSGGQVTNYLSRFLGRELRDTIDRCMAEESTEAVWQHTLRRLSGGWSNVRLHALFLIGIENEAFESLFEVPLQPVRTGDDSQRAVHGVVRIDVATGAGVISVPVSVHVADYTKPVTALCSEGILDRDFVERLLARREYSGIVKVRAKEHCFQFEPCGWKDAGGMVATYANCPANTLPIFWADGGERPWYPLFKRFFSPWDDGARPAEEVLSRVDPVIRKLPTDLAAKDVTQLKAYVLLARSRWDKGEIARHLSLQPAELDQAIRVFERRLETDPQMLEWFRTAIRATC